MSRASKFMATAEDLIMTQCVLCKNREHTENPQGCKAFPDGIPQVIIDNKADHRLPFEGDHGIRFEPRQEVAAALLNNVLTALDQIKS